MENKIYSTRSWLLKFYIVWCNYLKVKGLTTLNIFNTRKLLYFECDLWKTFQGEIDIQAELYSYLGQTQSPPKKTQVCLLCEPTQDQLQLVLMLPSQRFYF